MGRSNFFPVKVNNPECTTWLLQQNDELSKQVASSMDMASADWRRKGNFFPKIIINIAKGTTNPGLWQIPVTTFTNPCNNFDKCIKQLFLAVKLISARLDKQIDRTSFHMISLHTEIESVSLQIAEKTIVWRYEQMQSSIPLKWLWYCPGIIAARFCHNKDDLPMKWSVATRASSHARVTSVKSQQHFIVSEWMSEWLTDKARQWSDLVPIKA